MKLAEYSAYDALGLAELVAKKEVSPKELAQTAAAAREKIDGVLNAVVELWLSGLILGPVDRSYFGAAMRLSMMLVLPIM